MVLLPHAEETAERHDRIGHLAGDLIDHEIVHAAEALILAVLNGVASTLSDEIRRGVSSMALPAVTDPGMLLYQSPLPATGMRAGLAWRLRAKSI